jgi:hypothetical protein
MIKHFPKQLADAADAADRRCWDLLYHIERQDALYDSSSDDFIALAKSKMRF